MKTFLPSFVLRRVAWLNLPGAVLVMLLQRTPALRAFVEAERFVATSPLGQMLRGLLTAATLGAMHSRAGATTFVSPSPVNGKVGTALQVGFTYTGTPSSPASFVLLGGSLPPGLSFIPGESGGVIPSGTPVIAGVPTEAGTFSISVQGFNGDGGAGLTNGIAQSISFNIQAGAATAPTITPSTQAAAAGGSITLTANASTGLQWSKNGTAIAGATGGMLIVSNLQPGDAGLYAATAGSLTSTPAIVNVASTAKLIGVGQEFANVPHPNTNIFDQILPGAAAVSVTADAGQAVRISFIDLTNDIVQLEFSGAGTLTLLLDNPSGPAAPASYNQPTVSYMKGHPTIIITGANETTNVGLFCVGRSTAFDPTGAYNILQAPSATNVPASNGSSLFVGHAGTTYNGLADVALIAIASTNGQFGGLRCANANFFATKGYTGVYAPGVQFSGPVFMGDISAADTATPVILLGSASDTRITGGDLEQANARAVQVSGLVGLQFRNGSDSHGNIFAAKANKGVLEQNGANVTAQIAQPPTP